MDLDFAAPKPGRGALLLDHGRLHQPAALGLGVALLGGLALLLQNLIQVASGTACPAWKPGRQYLAASHSAPCGGDLLCPDGGAG